jgi:nucleoside-diphosphate-sugar epimerase
MWRQILVTGATGSIGPLLLAALLRESCAERVGLLIRPLKRDPHERFQRLVRALECSGVTTRPLFCVPGNLLGSWHRQENLRMHTEVVLHAAADTRFRSRDRLQEPVNIEGTRRVLEWARTCPRLNHLVLVSTTCVAGARTGLIAEADAPDRPQFINCYERSKWEAERLALDASLPMHLVRLSTCVSDAQDGPLSRPGAFHHSLRWMYHGLVPLIPGSPSSRLDLIPTNTAAAFVSRAVGRPPSGIEIHHVAAGHRAVFLAELVDFLVAKFRESHKGWRRGQIPRPLIVDATTFAAFRRSVTLSRDFLLGTVMESMNAFLPSLLYPKVYETARAEGLWGGPLPFADWRQMVGGIVRSCIESQVSQPVHGGNPHAA